MNESQDDLCRRRGLLNVFLFRLDGWALSPCEARQSEEAAFADSRAAQHSFAPNERPAAKFGAISFRAEPLGQDPYTPAGMLVRASESDARHGTRPGTLHPAWAEAGAHGS